MFQLNIQSDIILAEFQTLASAMDHSGSILWISWSSSGPWTLTDICDCWGTWNFCYKL